MNDKLHLKNPQTGSHETVQMIDITFTDWGFNFKVNSELDAYKAAYQYKASNVKIEYSQGAQTWLVTVFEEGQAKAA